MTTTLKVGSVVSASSRMGFPAICVNLYICIALRGMICDWCLETSMVVLGQ